MRELEKKLGKILNILKEEKHGMTVTEISRKLKLNRNSTAKYLDILLLSGRVELKRVGKAKEFHLSLRMPISAVFDLSSDMILVLDRELRVVDVNDNLSRFLNTAKDMMIGSHLSDTRLPILDLKEEMRLLKGALKGKDSSFEKTLVWSLGTFHFKVKLIPSILVDGTNGVIIMMENVTEEKKAKQLLKESEERFRTLFETSPDTIFLLDDRSIFYCNKSALQMFGVSSKEDLMRISPWDISPPIQPNGRDSKTLAREHIKKAFDEGTNSFEWVHMRRNGEPFLVEVRLIRLNLDGHATLQAFVRDITKFKKTQEDLRANELRLRNLLSSLHNSFIALIDKDLVIDSFWSEKGLGNKYGMPSETIVGRSILDFIPHDQAEEAKRMLRSILQTGRTFTTDTPTVTEKGTFWHRTTFSPFRTASGEIDGIVQFGVDITEEHRSMDAFKEMETRCKILDQNIFDVIWIANRKMEYTYITSSVRTMTGWEPEERIGSRIDRSITAESFATLQAEYGRELNDLISGKKRKYKLYTIEADIIKKDGSTLPVEIKVRVLTDAEGIPTGILGVTRERPPKIGTE